MSLWESCIAAVVVCTMMAISTPSLLKARQYYRLQSAAREVASALQSARILAVTRNVDCRLRTVSGVSYIVECQDGVWQTVERITVPPGITVASNNRPEFHRRGNVSPAATFTLTSDDSRSVRVVVNINGRVRVQ